MGRKSLSDEAGPPLVLGHRGAAARVAENTLASFQAALEAGADGIETDVRLTADGVAVLVHDADLARTTDGSGLVHQLTLEELRHADTGAGPIPTLAEALALVAGHGAGMALEVKNLPGDPGYDPAHEGAVDALLQEVEAFPDLPVLVVSFNPRSIERCRGRGVETGFISTAAMDPRVALRYAKEAGHGWVWPNVGAVQASGPRLMEEVHAAGLRIAVWTVDDPADVATLLGWGLDAVVTNVPDLAVAVRADA